MGLFSEPFERKGSIVLNKKILVADDSITIQKFVGITLAQEDIDIVFSSNGKDTLEKARAKRPDLVLADHQLPEIDGFEICRMIKEDPQLCHATCFVIYGIFEDFDKARFKASRADGTLVKPFESKRFIEVIRTHLSKVATPEEFSTAPTVLSGGGEVRDVSQDDTHKMVGGDGTEPTVVSGGGGVDEEEKTAPVGQTGVVGKPPEEVLREVNEDEITDTSRGRRSMAWAGRNVEESAGDSEADIGLEVPTRKTGEVQALEEEPTVPKGGLREVSDMTPTAGKVDVLSEMPTARSIPLDSKELEEYRTGGYEVVEEEGDEKGHGSDVRVTGVDEDEADTMEKTGAAKHEEDGDLSEISLVEKGLDGGPIQTNAEFYNENIDAFGSKKANFDPAVVDNSEMPTLSRVHFFKGEADAQPGAERDQIEGADKRGVHFSREELRGLIKEVTKEAIRDVLAEMLPEMCERLVSEELKKHRV